MAQLVRENSQLPLYILLATLLLSCVSTGNSGLTEGTIAKIVEGVSSKAEIAALLDDPEQILYLDEETLANYVNRVYLGEPPEVDFPEGHYEVWTYSKWNQTAVLVLLPTYEKATACVLIMNSDGICVKKLYAEISSLDY